MACFRFGPYLLDPEQRILLFEGQPVSLPLKAYETLLALVERSGKVVLKEDLLKRVWPDSFVEENSLSQNISQLRRTLTEPVGARYIETIPKRGFRFTATVEFLDDPAAPPMELVPIERAWKPPVTQYAQNGDVSLAYQVFGDGPVDLVFVMGWVSHVEYFWKEPSFARFLQTLGGFARVILFDKRGTGLSDRVAASELPTLEQRMEDLHAVMDAAGSRRAVLCGVSEGGPMSALFAATYPERTAGLVMIGTYAKRLRSDDYPWGPTPEQHREFLATVASEWGGPVGIEERAPSRASDEDFREWWATYLRMGASPSTAIALTRMNARIDVRQVLPLVRVPTLVLHRQGDRCLLAEEGRYVASLVPGACYRELTGDDHLPFVGDQEAILQEIRDFCARLDESATAETVLSTVMLLAGDPGLISEAGLGRWLRNQFAVSASWSGPGDHWVGAAFPGPVRAIRAAQHLVDECAQRGAALRAAVHTGECMFLSTGEVRGSAVDVAEKVLESGHSSGVVVSRTVRDLIAGSSFRFREAGSIALPGDMTLSLDLYLVTN